MCGTNRILFLPATLCYLRRMAKTTDPFEDLIITIKPEATPEEEERFLTELARVILAIARHVVTLEEALTAEEERAIDF